MCLVELSRLDGFVSHVIELSDSPVVEVFQVFVSEMGVDVADSGSAFIELSNQLLFLLPVFDLHALYLLGVELFGKLVQLLQHFLLLSHAVVSVLNELNNLESPLIDLLNLGLEDLLPRDVTL